MKTQFARMIRGCALLAGLCALCPLSGCGLMQMGRDTAKLFHPKPFDPEVEDSGPDPWSHVGRDGRGHQSRVKESDRLTPLLQSKQSRDIERNLGID